MGQDGAFGSVASDVFNLVADQRFSQLLGKPDKQIEVTVKDACVQQTVRQASVNRTRFRASSSKELRR